MTAAASVTENRFKLLQKCKLCGSPALTDVMFISPQFLSATFTRSNAEEGDLAKIQVPLTMTLCDRSRNPDGCGLLQLREEVEADLLYRRYFYRSATSDMMRNDLKEVIADISSRVDLTPNDIVVDIGANDCTTLGFYPAHLRRVGYEPRAQHRLVWRRSRHHDYQRLFRGQAVYRSIQGRKGEGGRLQCDVLRSPRSQQFHGRRKVDFGAGRCGAFSSAICR